jgi:hypothetical protein
VRKAGRAVPLFYFKFACFSILSPGLKIFFKKRLKSGNFN